MPRSFWSPFLGACALFFGVLSGGFAPALCFGADRPGAAASLSQVVDPETVREPMNATEVLRQRRSPVGDSNTRTWMAPRRSDVSAPVSAEVRDTVDSVFEPSCTLEGIVRLKPASASEGVVRLRDVPYVGHMLGWFFPEAARGLVRCELEVIDLDAGQVRMRQRANVLTSDAITICRNPDGRCAAETAGELLQSEGPITSLRQLRNRMMQQVAGATPAGPETPPVRQRAVDVGAVEDLVFPDPETGKRVIQAAGQGFRVVVLTPVADPHPIQDSLDCPRPLPIFQDSGLERHPEPTPSLAEVEGRVRMTAVPPPQDVRSDASELHRHSRSSLASQWGRAAKELQPYPVQVHGRSVTAAAPQLSMSAVEHLRMAARKLDEQGIHDAARQVERQAEQLDKMIGERLREVQQQVSLLQAEAERLKDLQGRRQNIQLRTQVIEFDRTRLRTEAGQRFLKEQRKAQGVTEGPFSKELAALCASSAFVERATRQKYAKILAMPTMVTTFGEAASLQIGSEQVVPGLKAKAVTTQFCGVSLACTPTKLGENRTRLQCLPMISELDRKNGNDATVSRRLHTQVDLNFGETAVIHGLRAGGSSRPATGIWPAAAEDEAAVEREVLFLVTPELIPEATWLAPPIPGAAAQD